MIFDDKVLIWKWNISHNLRDHLSSEVSCRATSLNKVFVKLHRIFLVTQEEKKAPLHREMIYFTSQLF